ncbi:MAG: prepilin peptidase, partial [Elusimicrobiota bacterium]
MLVNIFIFFIGTVFGSFLNVCIRRLPKEESIVFPASHCPKCMAPIRPTDNVPIISFLLLKGRCRGCRENIALQYPLVEFITGIAFFAAYYVNGLAPVFYFWALFLSLFIIGFFTDYNEEIIPDEIIFVGLIAG